MDSASQEIRRLSKDEIMCLPILKIAPWKEVIGDYVGSADLRNEFHMAVDINGKQYRITVPKGSRHRQILEMVEVLDDSPFSKQKKRIRIGILFTDDEKEPVKLKRIV